MAIPGFSEIRIMITLEKMNIIKDRLDNLNARKQTRFSLSCQDNELVFYIRNSQMITIFCKVDIQSKSDHIRVYYYDFEQSCYLEGIDFRKEVLFTNLDLILTI